MRIALALLVLLAAPAFAQETGYAVRDTEIKKEPYSDAQTLGTLAEKAQVKVLDRQNGWMQIESGTQAGWVRMLAIRMDTGSSGFMSGFKSLFSVARTGSSGRAVTTGVRGLDKEDIKNAKPNPEEVKKHHLTAMKKGKGMEAGANILSMYLDQQKSAAAKEKLVGGMKEIMLRGLDKDDEFEADRMGVVIAARAGYDPYGLPSVIQMLQASNPKDSDLALMFETHPAPGARLDALDRAIGGRLDRFAKQPQAAERYAGVMRAKP